MKKRFYLFLLLFIASLSLVLVGNTSEAKQKNYTISPNSKILKPYTKSPNVNKNTKHWFLIKSYLEKMEKNGGGTLTLKKGTYKISNSVYTPSNTTIILKDGVKIVKHNKVGKAAFKATQSIFQVTTPKLSKKKKKAKGYNGARNVSIIGEGNATIDLKFIKDSKGIIVAHCQNVTIENINFKNMHTGHFLEIDAAKNVNIKNCRFSKVHAKSPENKEAINIDTPDLNTGGLTLNWSNPDKTPNNTVTIENCKFTDLKRGIGTHKYSQKKANGTWSVNCYHENIVIQNNTFTNIKDTGIFMMNWKGATVSNNVFTNNKYCLNFRGVQKPLTLSGNQVINSEVTQSFGGKKGLIYNKGYTNTQSGSLYSPIYNDIGVSTVEELEALI